MITPLHNDPEKLAEVFHSTYENMAPLFHYKTRKESAVKWEDVPKSNKDLMVCVCTILQSLLADEVARKEALIHDYYAFTSGQRPTMKEWLEAHPNPENVTVTFQKKHEEAQE